jgi:hypothetical protein
MSVPTMLADALDKSTTRSRANSVIPSTTGPTFSISGSPTLLSKAIRPDHSNNSLDFYLPKPASPKFERSIFYDTTENGTEYTKDRRKSMAKMDMWSTPVMSRTKMVLADADRRVQLFSLPRKFFLTLFF